MRSPLPTKAHPSATLDEVLTAFSARHDRIGAELPVLPVGGLNDVGELDLLGGDPD